MTNWKGREEDVRQEGEGKSNSTSLPCVSQIKLHFTLIITVKHHNQSSCNATTQRPHTVSMLCNCSCTHEYGEMGVATTNTWFLFLKRRHRPRWFPRTSRSQTCRHCMRAEERVKRDNANAVVNFFFLENSD